MLSFFMLVLCVLSSLAVAQHYIDPVVGFFPQESPIPLKQQNNITIAFMLPYQTFWNIPNATDHNPDATWYMQMDAAAELAVIRINSDPEILPKTTVNILRVNNWDHSIGSDMGLGGMAVVAMETVFDSHNVLGVYAKTVDSISLVAAGIFSQLQMPMCGGDQNLPTLSDKQNYPYFYRVTFSAKWGSPFNLLLKQWNVKRVAMVYDGTDKESIGGCLDIRNALFSSNVIVLDYRYYMHESDFDAILEEFKAVDARYIILCAQSWSNSYNLLERANQTGLVSPNHVWLATNPPIPEDYDGSPEDPRLEILSGIVIPLPDFSPTTEPNYIALEQFWKTQYEKNEYKYQVPGWNWANTGGFDCVSTMLHGFHQILLKQNSSSGTLGGGKLQSLLRHDAFSSTGYRGIALNPMRLDSNGDALASTAIITISSVYWISQQVPFAYIGEEGDYIPYKALPMFYGGGSVPPDDGPPSSHAAIIIIDLKTPQGQAIIVLAMVGYAVCLLSTVFVFKCRKNAAVKPLNVGHMTVSLLGSIAMITSMIFYLERATSFRCYSRSWTLYIGFNLMVIPLICKNWFMWKIFSAKSAIKRILKRITLQLHAFTAGILLIQAGVLTAWSIKGDYRPKQYYVNGIFVIECTINQRSQLFNKVILALNLTIVLFLFVVAILSKNVTPKYNESSPLITLGLICVITITLSVNFPVTEIMPLQKCICIWMTAIAPPFLFVLPKAMEYFGERSLLSPLIMSSRSGITSKSLQALKKRETGGSSSSGYALPNNGEPSKIAKKVPTSSFCTAINARASYKIYRPLFNGILNTESEWKAIQTVVICRFHQRRWLLLRPNLQVECFVLMETSKLQVKNSGNQVFFIASGVEGLQGYSIQFEFETDQLANSFKTNLSDILYT
ncbi:periplasmic binding protein-like I [Obelidium mucronatum]|nr:periplasmic binding protein-like I [Obelidium mucronatum]